MQKQVQIFAQNKPSHNRPRLLKYCQNGENFAKSGNTETAVVVGGGVATAVVGGGVATAVVGGGCVAIAVVVAVAVIEVLR